jgi:hypothetical protein
MEEGNLRMTVEGGQPTFAGTRASDKVAPIPVGRARTSDRIRSTHGDVLWALCGPENQRSQKPGGACMLIVAVVSHA